jgi:YidC/Oxa1 family membrane protein insertase
MRGVGFYLSALVPVGISHARAEVTRRRLAPRISHLRQKHFGTGLRPEPALVFGTLLVAIGVAATLSRHFLAPLPVPATPGAAAAPTVPGTESLTRILSFLPCITVLFAVFVPLAAAIYLALTTIWGFVERLVLRRRMAD